MDIEPVPFGTPYSIEEGLMIKDVVLIEPRAPGQHVFSKFKLPRLGLPILGALLEREMGISARIYFQEVSKLDWGKILSADMVGISTITSTAPEAFKLLERIKRESDIPVVMGGAHVTFLPEEALREGVDYVVRGEGEQTFLELVGHLSNGDGGLSDIDGLSYTEGGVFRHNPDRQRTGDLSSLPWPDLSLIENFEKVRVVPMITSRGCPHNCKFCSVTPMFGHRYRYRDSEDVLAELEMLYRKNPKAVFFFYDDNFTASPSRTKELLGKMKEKGITPRWTAQATVHVVQDEELMQLMKDTGCLFLYLGLESANPETLKSYRKAQTVEDIVRAVEVIHKYKIKVHGMFVLGSDEDDRDAIRETVRFAKKTRIDTVQFLILTPLPGTEFYTEMCREGRIIVDDWSKFSGHHVVFRPRLMSPFKLQKEGTLRAMGKFYSLWQCWKLGLLFHWKDMAIRIYAHRTIVKWKARNREFTAELKSRYKEEKVRLKSRYKEEKEPLKRRYKGEKARLKGKAAKQ